MLELTLSTILGGILGGCFIYAIALAHYEISY